MDLWRLHLGNDGAGTNGWLDDMPVESCRPFEKELYRYVENAQPAIFSDIREKSALDDQLKERLNSLLKEFKSRFVTEHKIQLAK